MYSTCNITLQMSCSVNNTFLAAKSQCTNPLLASIPAAMSLVNFSRSGGTVSGTSSPSITLYNKMNMYVLVSGE